MGPLKTITSVSAAQHAGEEHRVWKCSATTRTDVQSSLFFSHCRFNTERVEFPQKTSDKLNNPGKGSTCLPTCRAKNMSGFMSCFMYGQKADLLGMAFNVNHGNGIVPQRAKGTHRGTPCECNPQAPNACVMMCLSIKQNFSHRHK